MKTNKPPKSKLGSDDFQTPKSALEPIVKYIPKHFTIWEPAQGKGNIVQFFQREGYEIIGSDIKDGVDFFEDKPNDKYDCIITNPPFSIKDEWLKRCYELEKPFMLLLPMTALEGIKRGKLYREYGVSIHLYQKRINYETPSGEGGGAWFPSIWLSWGFVEPNTINYLD
jgi:hypothetical protein